VPVLITPAGEALISISREQSEAKPFIRIYYSFIWDHPDFGLVKIDVEYFDLFEPETISSYE
jgi:hypothetical protein